MLSTKKIGILGGGQLGKMLCEAAMPWHLDISVLDTHESMPAARYCNRFVKGNFKKYEDVLQFGSDLDVLTIEIEHVNLDALIELEKKGVEVHPSPHALRHIVDKGLQKKFYVSQALPTSPFILVQHKAEVLEKLETGAITFPFVQKSRREGYDGRGVVAIHSQNELSELMDVPSVIEEMIGIDLEAAVITSRNSDGEVRTYDAVEMVFKGGANILDVLISPARISPDVNKKLIGMAEKIIKGLNMVGVLAIEFFIDKKGKIFINEMAPRPHNSGHQTIENNTVSQYQQHLRAILNWPLATPGIVKPSIMLNILGEEGYQGLPLIKGKKQVLEMDEVYFHWYGKPETKPNRKMGHVTILGEDIEKALEKARIIKNNVKVLSK